MGLLDFLKKDNSYWESKLRKVQKDYDDYCEQYNTYCEQYDRISEVYKILSGDLEEAQVKSQWAASCVSCYNPNGNLKWMGSNFDLFASEVNDNVAVSYKNYAAALNDIVYKVQGRMNSIDDKRVDANRGRMAAESDILYYKSKIS